MGRVGAREILARTDLVVMRGELAAIAAENLRLRGGVAGKDGQLAVERPGLRNWRRSRRAGAPRAQPGSGRGRRRT